MHLRDVISRIGRTLEPCRRTSALAIPCGWNNLFITVVKLAFLSNRCRFQRYYFSIFLISDAIHVGFSYVVRRAFRFSDCSARYLLRKASHLLVVRAIGDVETLALARSPDHYSLSSSTQSVVAMADWKTEPLRSPGTCNDYRRSEVKVAAAVAALHKRDAMESRMRRLELGRRRAEEKRRAAKAVRRTQATEWRQIRNEDSNGRGLLRPFLTCDTDTLASATASFEAVTHGASGHPHNGLSLEHVLRLKDQVSREALKTSKQPRGGENPRVHPTGGRASSGAAYPHVNEDAGVAFGTDEGKATIDENEGLAQLQTNPSLMSVSQGEGDISSPHAQHHGAQQEHSSDGPVAESSLLEAVAGLEARVTGGAIGLIAFVGWWVEAVSRAEIALKTKFMTPTSKKQGWRRYPVM